MPHNRRSQGKAYLTQIEKSHGGSPRTPLIPSGSGVTLLSRVDEGWEGELAVNGPLEPLDFTIKPSDKAAKRFGRVRGGK